MLMEDHVIRLVRLVFGFYRKSLFQLNTLCFKLFTFSQSYLITVTHSKMSDGYFF